jgi:hypothetical protein
MTQNRAEQAALAFFLLLLDCAQSDSLMFSKKDAGSVAKKEYMLM